MKLFQTILVVSAGFGGVLAASPALAETPPYPYCMIGTPNIGRDCLYSTIEQCRVAASAGVGFCQENPAYTVLRQAVPAPKRR